VSETSAANAPPAPPDYSSVGRVTDELRALSLKVEELQRSIDITDAIQTYEARVALERARKDLKTAGFWLTEAIKGLSLAVLPRSRAPS
jgi:hypothetical protein